MTPLISVITTVYNCEPYLQQSLQSVLNQSFQDFELIIIDDGSSDSTLEIAKQFYQTNKVRILINKNNEGCNIGRNRGLLSSKGEYIAIHDGDDISLPLRLEKQITYLQQNKNISVVGGWAEKINNNGKTIGYMTYPALDTSSAIRSILQLKLNPIIDPSCMYRKADIIELGGYSMKYRYSACFDLWCRMLLHNKLLANIPEILIQYRENPTGTTQQHRTEMNNIANKIIGSFRAKNMNIPALRPSYFNRDCFQEYKESFNG